MDILSKLILESFLLGIGIFGNLTGLVVFSRKRLKNFPPRKMFFALAVVDSSFLAFTVISNFIFYENISLRASFQAACKIYNYTGYFLSPISSWLLVFISFHRFISIAFQNPALLNKPMLQIIVIMVIVVYNLILYSPILFFSGLANSTKRNSTACDYHDPNSYLLITIIELINAVVLPFILMLVLSLLLIRTIVKSKLKIIRMKNRSDKNKLRKSIKFAVSSIFSNIFFLTLNLPSAITNIIDIINVKVDLRSVREYLFCVYLFSFCVNFYILFCFNSVFRNEVFIMFGLRKIQYRVQ